MALLRKSYSGKIYLSNVFEGQRFESLSWTLTPLWKLTKLCWRSFCWDLFFPDGQGLLSFPVLHDVWLLNIDSLKNASFVLFWFLPKEFWILIVIEEWMFVYLKPCLYLGNWHKLLQERFPTSRFAFTLGRQHKTFIWISKGREGNK